ncbi:MAG: histidinol-phosphatase [Candidatus Dormibacteraeota bacterium]|uniref:Histidinol-phosphatase n=1 Tax=Candidatus Amunia macphersoniae TaxID=3127014 RepID=A0A934NER6_9BACT|nr:histidinol-phosphatase [Candidatus Dormibacteraeota bacterium]
MTTELPVAALEEELAFANGLADIADSISMERFRALDLVVTTKPDLTPVTEVDHAIELAIRDLVAQSRVEHTVVGEEFGGDLSDRREWRWVIDPIDGTRSFVRGNETWGTLIALQRDGETMVAVASTPAFGHRYSAVRGAGATVDGRPLHVSRVNAVDEAMIAHSSVSGFARVGMADDLVDLASRCGDARGLGNTLSHLSVARGTADIGWTARANLWDYAALSLIVEESGGRFLDRSGDGVLGGTGLSTNGLLHARVLQLTGADVNRHP